MPARTFPPVPQPANHSISSRQHSHHYPASTHTHTHGNSDIHDERLQGTYALYDTMTIPPPSMALNNHHNPFQTPEHRYPGSFIPPPAMQVHHYSASPAGPGPSFISYPGSSSALLHSSSFSGGASGTMPPATWPAQPHPVFRPAPLSPPPPLPHKVWILDCKSCDTFLTNRGMRAVLLLRPNVPLYSTDAMPINCSAYTDPVDTSSTTMLVTPPNSAGSQSSGYSMTDGERMRTLARTCECLTQTLRCHGCGSSVGYMIVTPCHRCMSSITATNRSTNGHRFVFYSSEIVASERHYISGENGVRPFFPSMSSMPSLMSPSPPRSMPPQILGAHYLPMHRTFSHPLENPPASIMAQELTPESRRSSTSAETHSPMSPIEFARSVQPSPQSGHGPTPPGMVPPVPPPSHSTSPQMEDGRYHSPPYSDGRPEFHHSSSGSSVALERYTEPLKAGEVVYWHHLVRSGESPAVIEDSRARGPKAIAAEDVKSCVSRSARTVADDKQITGRSRGVVAGR